MHTLTKDIKNATFQGWNRPQEIMQLIPFPNTEFNESLEENERN